MSRIATVAVRPDVSALATSVASRVSRIQGALGRFAGPGRLETLPGEIDRAIAELRALRPTVGDLRVKAGLRRHPPKTSKPEEPSHG